ncbi:MAG: MBL fold hydrolase [Betaproteobacteria bacterium RIFCSPLOWO2_12_FULL_62_13]|nr:MAG: MBL fold hydrolase [Betaproteobacteria bacterium RIFCSPLOWO2_12_FULL_62_13]
MTQYEVFAIRYGTRAGRYKDRFLGGDAHDGPSSVDYFVWVAVGNDKTFVIDTGFTAEDAVARKRTMLRCPIDTMKELGIKAENVTDVVLTHLHYDHAGNFARFPNATLHLQDKEMEFATGRFMQSSIPAAAYDVDDIAELVRLNFSGRLRFHDGAAEIAPGFTVHRMGGHTAGVQCVRVYTRRGWVVLASDSSHFYDNFINYRPYPTVFDLAEMLNGYSTLRQLAATIDHIIPGHDPLVMNKYPPVSRAMEGVIVRLDVQPTS